LCGLCSEPDLVVNDRPDSAVGRVVSPSSNHSPRIFVWPRRGSTVMRMIDERWSGIESRAERGTVFAWLGREKDGTFQGSVRVDIDGDVAYLAHIHVEEAVRRRGLGTALLATVLDDVPGIRIVHAHLVGSEGDRYVESLRRRYPDIEFLAVDDD